MVVAVENDRLVEKYTNGKWDSQDWDKRHKSVHKNLRFQYMGWMLVLLLRWRIILFEEDKFRLKSFSGFNILGEC